MLPLLRGSPVNLQATATRPLRRNRVLLCRMPTKGAKRKSQTTNGSSTTRKKFRGSESTSPERVFSAPSPTSDPLRQPHPLHEEAEEHGIVLREFYPPEMSNARARAYRSDEIQRPMELLNAAIAATASDRKTTEAQDAVVHWFKMDLRTRDNQALYAASQRSQEAGVPLIALYIVSPEDFVAHLTAPVRVDFTLRTLKVLKEDLAKLDIPLHIETVNQRKQIPQHIVGLMEEWGASHLYANMEYEVDELRREARLVQMLANREMALHLMHDTCVVPPGQLASGSGNQYAVYAPWYRSWVGHIHGSPVLLELADPPKKNPAKARQSFKALFDCPVPDAPSSKKLGREAAKKYASQRPAKEHEAMHRLDMFCKEKIGQYGANRNIPGEPGTSSLSVHLASGTLSARTAVRTARDRNRTKKLDAGDDGIQTWISEVAWRDFYKHVLVRWPYVW